MNNAETTGASAAAPSSWGDAFRRICTRDVFLVAFLVIGILLLVLWPRISITIRPGHKGVFYDRLFGGTNLKRTYGEGLHLFLPWNEMIEYDCRLQKENYTIPALAQGGLEVTLDITAIWSVDHNRANLLHIMAGPAYMDKLITPPVVSAVRVVIGGFQQERLYDLALSKQPAEAVERGRNIHTVKERVLEQARRFMKASISPDKDEDVLHPIHLIDIQIKRIILPETLRKAIDDKFVAEQRIFEERYRVLGAYERYKRGYIDSQAIRMKQTIIGDGLSENYLRHEGILATRDLAASRNAKLVLIGGKDGLPLLLNPDSLSAGADEPGHSGGPETHLSREELVKRTSEGEDWNLDYELLNRSLEEIESNETGIFSNRVLDRRLPRIGQVGGLSVDKRLDFFHGDTDAGGRDGPPGESVPGVAAPTPPPMEKTPPASAPGTGSKKDVK